MQKKLPKFLIVFFLLASACTKDESYILSSSPNVLSYEPNALSHIPSVRSIEIQDHKFCSSLQLGLDKTESMRSTLYWRCRLSLAKNQLRPNENAPQEDLDHNQEISDLIAKISLKLAHTPELTLVHENKKMDNRQHQQCLAMGFDFQTKDQAKVDDYFACRKILIENQQMIPPFGNEELLKYPNRSYNLTYVIDQRIDEDIKAYQGVRTKYPTCSAFNLYSADFANCSKGQDNSRQCFQESVSKKRAKELEEKIACQKQAYLEFSDDLLREDDRASLEIQRMKTNSDYYNRSSLASIGIDDPSLFGALVSKGELKKAPKEKTVKEINSNKGLYSKLELTKLRQKYIFSCQRDAERAIKKFNYELDQICNDMAKFKLEAEE